MARGRGQNIATTNAKAFHCSVAMANQGPQRAADEPYGEASFRTFTNHSFPLFFQKKGGPQRPPFVTERAYFVHKRAICTIFAIFLTVRESCTHFPLAFTRRPGATPLLGRRLRAGRTFASPFWNFQNRWSFWRLRVRLGRPLASAGWEGVALAALPVPDQQLHNA